MTAESAVQLAAGALNVHRWKSMGISSVECECGTILHGDDSLTRFPADDAFRRHIALAVLAAVEPLIRADALQKAAVSIIEAGPGVGFELRLDGSEDPAAAAYVQGFGEAVQIVRSLASHVAAGGDQS